MKNLKLSKKNLDKWFKNVVYFTAPALIVLFSLLSQGVKFGKAWPVAVLALYGVAVDYLKKLKK